MSQRVDQLPPHSVEAEQGVLGCILLEPASCMARSVEKLKAGAAVFYDERHKTIWNACAELYERQHAIDTITLQQRLRDLNVLENVGGLAYLSSLTDATPGAANLDYYLPILLEKHALRRILAECAQATLSILEGKGTAQFILDDIEAAFSRLTEEETAAAEEHIRVITRRVADDIQLRHYARGSTQLRGLPTGPEGNYLDKILRGIRESYYVVLAGRPGSGKTSLAMNILEYLALDYQWFEPTGELQAPDPIDPAAPRQPVTVPRRGVPVMIFSIEMDGDSLVERLLFARGEVDSATFTEGYAAKDSFDKLIRAAGELAKSNIYVDATPAQTIGQIAAKARRAVKQYGIKLFILDYIQLVEQEGGNGMDRQRELTKISRKIMALKKQLQVPWIVLAQMNRAIETAERDRAPVLSDLKDCGALEQDADAVLFCYKTPLKQVEKGSGDQPSDAEILEAVARRDKLKWSEMPYRVDLVVPKNRFGPTGTAQAVFRKNFCKFEDWHIWKVRNQVESLKAGERRSKIDPEDVPPPLE